MDITSPIAKGKNIINSYSDSGFKISEKKFAKAVILTLDKVKEIDLALDQINNAEKLLSFLIEFSDQEIDTLLIGTGSQHQRWNAGTRARIKEKFPSVSVDEMSTGAACRTFNILALEDRNVAAILVI